MDATFHVYYLEVNIMCMILLLYVYITHVRLKKATSTEDFWFRVNVFEAVIYCLMDILAAFFKGKTFFGARGILYVSNTVYIAMPLILIITWARFVETRLSRLGYKKNLLESIMEIVLIILAVVLLSTPITDFSFSLDAQNIYHRKYGAYVAAGGGFLSLLYVTAKELSLLRHVEYRRDREKILSLTFFSIPVVIASVIQVLFYGTTVAQVGFTLAILMVYVFNQQNLISKDELTGLNNRHEFERHLSNISHMVEYVLMCVIDINNFKTINDTYGHAEGDKALKAMGNALAEACRLTSDTLFLARIGGDEFVIVGGKRDRESLKEMEEKLRDELSKSVKEKSKEMDAPYEISVSIGLTVEALTCPEDIKTILNNADMLMYEAKRNNTKLLV